MGICVVNLLALFAQFQAKERVARRTINVQDSIDKLVDELVQRFYLFAHTARLFHRTDLKNTTLGQGSRHQAFLDNTLVAMRTHVITGFVHAPPCSTNPLLSTALSKSPGSRLHQAPATHWHRSLLSQEISRPVATVSPANSVPVVDEGALRDFGRRDAMLALSGGGSVLANTAAAFAATATAPAALATSWTATDGFSDKSFISFDESAYNSIRDDQRRTPLFVKAIQQRLAKAPAGTLSMLDLGTGPEALFAVAAARAGAKMVYAIEANREVANRAREAIDKAKDIAPGTIKVIEGFSTDVTLPEKVDFIVAEIAGSVSSEEGAYATIRDAQARFAKQPSDPTSYIPYSIQTFAAPASYALHHVYGPPEFDWDKLKGEPVRLNCRDTTLELIADPLLVEDIRFSDLAMPVSGKVSSSLAWRIDPDRVSANEKVYYNELRTAKVPEQEAVSFAKTISQSVSGIALWPRLLLDSEGTLVVESRGPKGEHQKSHWTTVLPILSSRPAKIELGATLSSEFEVDLRDGKVTTPLKYSFKANLN